MGKDDVVGNGIKNNTDFETVVKEETISNTKVVWKKKEVTLKSKTMFFTLHGHTDFESIINTLELNKPKKLIFFGEDVPANYYYYYFSFNPNFDNVFILKDELNLNIDDKNYKYLTVNEEFYLNVDFKKINNFFYSSFIGKIENNTLIYIEKSRPFLIGDIKAHELKKRFIGEGLKVEINNNILTVEDEVEIIFNNENNIEMHGEINDLYISVRNILYKDLVFL